MAMVPTCEAREQGPDYEIVPPGASFNRDDIRYVPPAQQDMLFRHH